MKAIVYTKNNCPYCIKAKHLLTKQDAEIEEISAVEHRDELFAKVTEATGNPPKTVPQIFIDDEYVGGHDQLVAWLEARNETE